MVPFSIVQVAAVIVTGGCMAYVMYKGDAVMALLCMAMLWWVSRDE